MESTTSPKDKSNTLAARIEELNKAKVINKDYEYGLRN